MKKSRPIDNLKTYKAGSHILNVMIETPKHSRNKYKYESKSGLFRVNKVLPAGAVFPFDFGFIPATLGEDGDPLDVLMLMEEPAFTGCLVEARVIGVIEAKEKEKNETKRNDRVVAVALISEDHADVQKLSDLNQHLRREIEYFFVSYNRLQGREFKCLGQFGPKRARLLIRRGMRAFQKK